MSTKTVINNATRVRALYEAFGCGDIPFILSHLASNCKWVASGEGSLPEGGTYIGKEAGKFFVRLAEGKTFTAFNPVSINTINEQEVVVFGNLEAVSNSTGKKMQSDWVMHWKFNEEGEVVYFHDFFDTAVAYLANQQ
jgi:ketosteroid isomerase-like protein